MNKMYIQCTDVNGNIGSFIKNEVTGQQVTPTFSDVITVMHYCMTHGIKYSR